MVLRDYYIPIKGYEMIEKTAGKSGNSAYIYLPARWAGKKIKVIALEPLDPADAHESAVGPSPAECDPPQTSPPAS